MQRVISAAVIALAVVLLATSHNRFATGMEVKLAGRSTAQVDSRVMADLNENGVAHVIVALSFDQTDAADNEYGMHQDELQRRISAAQDRVLESVSPGSFEVTSRLRYIPALAGEVNAAGLEQLAKSPGVVAIGPDPVLELVLDSSVPFIGADKVRRSGTTGKGQVVAVLDTGVDTDHLDIRDGLKDQACFLKPATYCPSAPNVAEDSDGHGTHVTGIVASRGKRSSYGVAPGAEIVSIKMIEERNNAAGSGLMEALDWLLARDDIDVINMSFGSGAYEGYCDDASAYTRSIAAAFGRLKAKGVISVGSSGNDGSSTKLIAPACLRDVISVGAVEDAVGSDARVAGFTNRNDTLDLLAPGVAVESSFLSGRTATMQGTSQAGPHVAGAIALMREAHPWADQEVILAALKSTGGRPTIRYGATTISTIKVDAAIRELDRNQPTVAPTVAATDTPSATPTATATLTPAATDTLSATPEPVDTQTPLPSATQTPGVADTATPTDTAAPATTPTPSFAVYMPIAYRED